ncbi:MAG: uroporphyrinogen-III synthase [Bacteroidia bacterium]|nr:uroporphyrinogen-III synthase [Bacteroidia bacterium]
MGERIVTVLNTRPEPGDFDDALQARGLGCIHLPMIRIADPESWDALDAAVDRMGQWDGVLLTSANAVRYFLRRLEERMLDVTDLPPVHLIGLKTAAVARRGGLLTASISEAAYGSAMAADLPDVAGRHFLQPCSDIARDEVLTGVLDRGGQVQQVPVYRILGPEAEIVNRLRALHAENGYDWAAFFSPSAVRYFIAALPEFLSDPRPVAVIGETTAVAASALGVHVDLVAHAQSAEALADALAERAARSAERRA